VLDTVFVAIAKSGWLRLVIGDRDFPAKAHRVEAPVGESGTARQNTLESVDRAHVLLAAYMAHSALRFAADHEFFHAVHGHVLLVEELFDRPLSENLARLAAPYEQDVRLALEMGADRSAIAQQIRDIAEGSFPTNDAVDALSLVDRIGLIIVATAAMLAIWAQEENGELDAGYSHPSCETRLYMLLGPTLVRALSMTGLDASAITSAHQSIIRTALILSGSNSVFSAIGRAMDPARLTTLDIENQRLEMVYRLDLAPLLVGHKFLPALEG
jgi:hypothetical protein